MFIQNAAVQQGMTVSNQNNVVMRKDSDRLTSSEQEANLKRNTLAAVFQRSAEEDYAGKNLNAVQKSIMNLQKQKESIEENDHIDEATKRDLLDSIDEQLKNLEKELNDPEQIRKKAEEKEERDKVEKQQAAADDGQVAIENGGLFFIGAGLDLKQMEVNASLSAKAASHADRAEVQLKRDIKNQFLKDKDLIAKKRKEIQDLREIAQNVQKYRPKAAEVVSEETGILQQPVNVTVQETDEKDGLDKKLDQKEQ